MRKAAAEIRLTNRQKEILERMAKSTHGELHFKNRATILLKAAEGISNRLMSKQMDINRAVARKWRIRWAYASKQLEQVNTAHKIEQLRRVG